MKQTENGQIKKIPPLTKTEIIDFHTTGRMPDRFEKTGKVKRDEILRQNGVNIEFVSAGE